MKILHISDIHMGHPRVHASITYNSLRTHVYPLLSDVDVLIIGGDTADRGLALDSSPSRIIVQFLMDLCDLIKKYNFLLRIVRGTWSHDRDSVRIINTIAKSKRVSNKVKYFDTIEIEYIKKFNRSFMYVPDDVPFDDLEHRIINKIKDTKTGKVDVMVFHGAMKHALPYMPKVPVNTVNADNWNGYINEVCCCGHIHQRSVYKNKFIFSGSFDRSCHGDEGAKGCFLIDLKDDGTRRIKFIENPSAVIFKTLDFNNISMSDGIDLIAETIAKCSEDRLDVDIPTYIRILVNDMITKAALLGHTSKAYGTVKNIKISYKSDNADIVVDVEEDEEESVFIVTPDNLPQIIAERINQKLSVERISEILDCSG